MKIPIFIFPSDNGHCAVSLCYDILAKITNIEFTYNIELIYELVNQNYNLQIIFAHPDDTGKELETNKKDLEILKKQLPLINRIYAHVCNGNRIFTNNPSWVYENTEYITYSGDIHIVEQTSFSIHFYKKYFQDLFDLLQNVEYDDILPKLDHYLLDQARQLKALYPKKDEAILISMHLIKQAYLLTLNKN